MQRRPLQGLRRGAHLHPRALTPRSARSRAERAAAPQVALAVRGRARAAAPAALRARVRRWAARMAAEASAHELSLLLCDDDEIRALNRTYRRKDRPTDVLSFALQEGEGSGVQPGVLGDVVISVETAARQAGRRGLEGELLHLLAHGICHLLGYDHRTDAEEATMRAREAELRAACLDRR